MLENTKEVRYARNFLMRWINKRFRNKFSCSYCGRILLILWKWIHPTKLPKCGCPGYMEALYKSEKGRRNANTRAEHKAIKTRGSLLTVTANRCIVCDGPFPFPRARGQIQHYCSKRCRRARHNAKKMIPDKVARVT